LRREAGRIRVEFPVGGDSIHVESWVPPRLVLRRGSEVRAFFVASDDAGNTWLKSEGRLECIRAQRARRHGLGAAAPGHEDLSSPMPGKVLEVLVAEGDRVAAGHRLIVVVAMKMELPIRAPRASVVARIHTRAGASVAPGEILIELDETAE
jgi:biotin carboxyl carrier protein